MAQYVEKMRVPVRVRLFGGEAFDGWLSVAPHSAIREGPETLHELLNSPVRVLPFILAEDESVMLLSREHLNSVEPTPEADPELVRPPHYLVTREEQVAVEWLDGHRAEGIIPMELPRDLNRASDYLNGDDDFFPLITADGTQLVNKLRLRGVRIFSESPRPEAVVLPFNAA
jgi:hypothetical protein